MKNIKIDETSKTMSIKINPQLYSSSCVMRASYRFIDDFNVIVDGDPMSELIVCFKPKEETDNPTKEDWQELINIFYNELIHTSVEEEQARRYADTRNALIGAAMKTIIQVPPNKKQEKKK
ncbi:MAG: hypothetical protein B6U87_02275 [Candidatus Aenigmarchaeota archaeon ex4484_52]|nr:MAG: hypothetical protein B6U87_02275 [Candidatus Aenigmarchaeota archaeon ex4484_52]